MISYKIKNKNPFQILLVRPGLLLPTEELWERRVDGTWHMPGHYSVATEDLKRQLDSIFTG